MYNFLINKKKEGKIHHLGFSFHDNSRILKELVENYEWDFAQIQLNYLDWDDSQNSKFQYEYLTENNIPVTIMEPVRGGALATLNEKAAVVLKHANPNVSLASWAIRFAASLPNVVTVLSGMSNLEQVEDNIKTMSHFELLSNDEYRIINEAANIYRASGTIPCTGCRYCVEYCQKNVDIPQIFGQFNLFNLRNKLDPGAFLNNYRTILEEQQAHNCISCKKCISHCPQGIQIPDYLKEIREFVDSVPWDE
jgi:predicted aldo/keto reductase-like oxidoreductase